MISSQFHVRRESSMNPLINDESCFWALGAVIAIRSAEQGFCSF